MSVRHFLISLMLCPLAQAFADNCNLLLQSKTVTGVGVRDYIEAQPELKARILAHPNGQPYLQNLNSDTTLEKIPSTAELESRLTKAEVFAIGAYAGAASRRINEYCCRSRGLIGKLLNWRTAGYHDKLVSGLAKLDPFEGGVFRDVHISDENTHAEYLREGSVIQPKRFWSTSRLRTRQYGGDTRRGKFDLTLVIRSRSGRSIERMGWLFIDYEVLFSPASRYRVDMVFPRVGGSYLVFLTEL